MAGDRPFIWLYTTRTAKVWRVVLATALAVVLATTTRLGVLPAVAIASVALVLSLLPVPIPDRGEPGQEEG